jgi:gliding motility-associated-like protein
MPLYSLVRWVPSFIAIVLLLHVIVFPGAAVAQRQYHQWHFGNHVSLQFPGGTAPPVSLAGSQMVSGEGCAAIADTQGQLLFYSNGIQAWNKLHQPLANGTGLGGYDGPSELPPNSATQGAAIIAKPGSLTDYYLFTVDAAENNLQGGFTYSVVDMSRQAGLGEVVTKAVRLPTPLGDGRVAEKLAIVRHANQRDVWVIVHGWNTNLFYSWLVTPDGIATTPIVSAGGQLQQGSGDHPASKNYNAIGQLKVSPNGQRLALVQFYSPSPELFDFNCGTGIVSNPRRLTNYYTYSSYGVEFSPNSNLLYVSCAQGLVQYNLLSTQASLISSAYSFGSIQIGPNDQLYYMGSQSSHSLQVIQQPNQLGLACALQPAGITLLAGSSAYIGLPNVLVTPPESETPLVSFGVVGTGVCTGELTSFTAATYPAMPGATVTWDFGEPAAGGDNTAVGLTAQHRYARAGTYQASMQLVTASGQVYTYAQPVVIFAELQSQLWVSAPPCTGQLITLSIVPPPPRGSTYTWQDGSTNASLDVSTSGTYWVNIVPLQACAYRNILAVEFSPPPIVNLGPDRSIDCDEVITLDATTGGADNHYRWQDGSTSAQYRVALAGTYTVAVSAPGGCTTSATVKLFASDKCLVSVPNVITPNDDHLNDKLVVQGVAPGTCTLSIYNRWGKQIYEQAHYANNWDASGQASGLYYYLVTTSTNQHYKGWVEVVHDDY